MSRGFSSLSCPPCAVRLTAGLGCWKEVLGSSVELEKRLSFFLNLSLLQDLPRMIHGDCKMPVVGEGLELSWVQTLVIEGFCAVPRPRVCAGRMNLSPCPVLPPPPQVPPYTSEHTEIFSIYLISQQSTVRFGSPLSPSIPQPPLHWVSHGIAPCSPWSFSPQPRQSLGCLGKAE